MQWKAVAAKCILILEMFYAPATENVGAISVSLSVYAWLCPMLLEQKRCVFRLMVSIEHEIGNPML